MEPEIATLDDVAAGHALELAEINYDKRINTSSEDIRRNVQVNMVRSLPELRLRAGLVKDTASLCGSAPSLLDTIGEIKGDVIAFNSAIRALAERNVPVRYAMIWDATPEMTQHITLMPGTTWLVASRCHPAVFEILLLLKQDVLMWHAAGDDIGDVLDGHEQILGGAQAVTRGVFVAACLGYRDLHVFGADSSFETDETHVGGSVREEHEVLLKVEDRVFRTTFWMASQAEDWQSVLLPFAKEAGLKLTVHGSGLLPFVHELWVKNNG